MPTRTLLAVALGALLYGGLASTASAGIIYSNVTNFTGFGVTDGGAANVAGDNITTLLADDTHQVAGFAGQSVSQLKYTVANFNSSSVSARPLLRFYQSDGSGGTPGTLILALTVNPMTFAPNSVAVFTANLLPGQLVVPTSFFWAGITFDDNFGTTGATLAQLNNLGQGIYNPPTVGSSDDQFFATSSAGSFASNNPPGGMFNFGGNPLANFGWEFSTPAPTAAVPEPSAALLAGLGALCLFARTWGRKSFWSLLLGKVSRIPCMIISS